MYIALLFSPVPFTGCLRAYRFHFTSLPLPKTALAADAAFALRVANAELFVSSDDCNVSRTFPVQTTKNSGPNANTMPSAEGLLQYMSIVKPTPTVQVAHKMQMGFASAILKGVPVQAENSHVRPGLHANGGLVLGRRHQKIKVKCQSPA